MLTIEATEEEKLSLQEKASQIAPHLYSYFLWINLPKIAYANTFKLLASKFSIYISIQPDEICCLEIFPTFRSFSQGSFHYKNIVLKKEEINNALDSLILEIKKSMLVDINRHKRMLSELCEKEQALNLLYHSEKISEMNPEKTRFDKFSG